MILDPSAEPPTRIYHALVDMIVPRPIGWVSTLSAAGEANLAPFSFFTGVGVSPPSLCFSPINRRDGSAKDTLVNVRAVPEFVLNVVNEPLGAAMNATSAEFPPDEDEFDAAGLARVASEKVRPPGVRHAPVRFECRLLQIVPVGDGPLAGNLILGEIVLIHVRDEVLDDGGRVDPARLRAIGRMGGADTYVRTTDLFAIPRPR